MVIFELKEQGFFSKEEEEFIEKYVAETTFDVESFYSGYMHQTLLDREGNGVMLGYEVFEEPEHDFIFQKKRRNKTCRLYDTFYYNQK